VNPRFSAHNVLNFGLTFPRAFMAEPPAALREHFRQITASLWGYGVAFSELQPMDSV